MITRDKIWLLHIFHTTLSHHFNHVSNKNLKTGKNRFTFYPLLRRINILLLQNVQNTLFCYVMLSIGYYFIFTSIFTLCIFLIPSSSSEFTVWDFHWNWTSSFIFFLTSSFSISYNSSLLISKFLSSLSESVLIFMFEWYQAVQNSKLTGIFVSTLNMNSVAFWISNFCCKVKHYF